MVRYQWLNKMTWREFDEWNIRTWDGEKWAMFSGAKVIEWRKI